MLTTVAKSPRSSEKWTLGRLQHWRRHASVFRHLLSTGKPATSAVLLEAASGWKRPAFLKTMSVEQTRVGMRTLANALDVGDCAEIIADETRRGNLAICLNAFRSKVLANATNLRTTAAYIECVIRGAINAFAAHSKDDEEGDVFLLGAFDAIFALFKLSTPLRSAVRDDVVIASLKSTAKMIAGTDDLVKFTFALALPKIMKADLGDCGMLQVVIDVLALATRRFPHHSAHAVANVIRTVHRMQDSEKWKWFSLFIGEVLTEPQSTDSVKLALRWNFGTEELLYHFAKCSTTLKDVFLSGALYTQPKDARRRKAEIVKLLMKSFLLLLKPVVGHLPGIGRLTNYWNHVSTFALFKDPIVCDYVHSPEISCDGCLPYTCCPSVWMHKTKESTALVSSMVRRKVEECDVSRKAAVRCAVRTAASGESLVSSLVVDGGILTTADSGILTTTGSGILKTTGSGILKTTGSGILKTTGSGILTTADSGEDAFKVFMEATVGFEDATTDAATDSTTHRGLPLIGKTPLGTGATEDTSSAVESTDTCAKTKSLPFGQVTADGLHIPFPSLRKMTDAFTDCLADIGSMKRATHGTTAVSERRLDKIHDSLDETRLWLLFQNDSDFDAFNAKTAFVLLEFHRMDQMLIAMTSGWELNAIRALMKKCVGAVAVDCSDLIAALRLFVVCGAFIEEYVVYAFLTKDSAEVDAFFKHMAEVIYKEIVAKKMQPKDAFKAWARRYFQSLRGLFVKRKRRVVSHLAAAKVEGGKQGKDKMALFARKKKKGADDESDEDTMDSESLRRKAQSGCSKSVAIIEGIPAEEKRIEDVDDTFEALCKPLPPLSVETATTKDTIDNGDGGVLSKAKVTDTSGVSSVKLIATETAAEKKEYDELELEKESVSGSGHGDEGNLVPVTTVIPQMATIGSKKKKPSSGTEERDSAKPQEIITISFE